ncbi:hypothetical protein RUMGNA_01512 [Mediterraneibacter gnavus ATCC 29149]|uniref:Uncharacterized protein n=1 Tax=Mediterraneibacter gnavus (strain ATCC 29149 / DSM 114966 / JCM 6515 / VPI C7-9) TaxID=411470 RepID=A7B1T6_MEDG7|nr:hypothetical protein RUMGNA_01512 [Mediterraneibacter gnavus ATCC 29149]
MLYLWKALIYKVFQRFFFLLATNWLHLPFGYYLGLLFR